MSTDLFLSDEELRVLTGYRQPSKQVAHLRKVRIPFHPNKAGHPRVARAAVEGRKVSATSQKDSKTTWSPSWAGAPAKT